MIPGAQPTETSFLRQLVHLGFPRDLPAAYRLQETVDMVAATVDPEDRTTPSLVPALLRRAAGRLLGTAASAAEVSSYVAAVRVRLPAGEDLLPAGPAERTVCAALAAERDDLPIAGAPKMEIMMVLAVEMLRDLALSDDELDELFASAERLRESWASAAPSVEFVTGDGSASGPAGPRTISGRYLYALVRRDQSTKSRLEAELNRLRSGADLVVLDNAFDVAVERMFANERDDGDIVGFLAAVRRRYELDDDSLPTVEAEALIKRSLGQRVQVPPMSLSVDLDIRCGIFMGVMDELGLPDCELRESIAEAERRAVAAGHQPTVFAG
jgi:hypothetical protein